MRHLLLALLAVALLPAPALAYVVKEHGALETYGNGITLGPDGNLWAVDAGAGEVVRMRPDGTVIGRFAVGPDPTSIAAGPGGRVWVAVTGADKLVWINATAPSPSTHDVSTASVSNCGPVAVEPGGDGRIYFSLPSDGSGIGGCTDASRIGYTNDDGTGGSAAFERGRAYDLQISGGKLFVPDFGANVIRRLTLDATLTPESVVSVSGGNPDGITVDGTGRIWVTLFTTGKVAYFPSAQQDGAATELTPSGGTLSLPFGIVRGPEGGIYVTGRDSANLARIDPATLQWTFFAVPGAKPWQIVNGPDEDLWFTDIGSPRLWRFVNGKPRATTVRAEPVAATAANLLAQVDPRGNATSVVFDYGTTPAYGSTTGPVSVAADAGPVGIQLTIQDLAPSTTYHARVRATNAEGETTGAGVTFTTPAAPVTTPPPAPPAVTPRLGARPAFSWRVRRRYTQLTKVRATGLAGGEAARLTCKGRGCPFRSRTFRELRAGTRKFDRYFRRRKLRPKARVEMRITMPGSIGAVTTVRIRRGRKPVVTRRCVPPGASRPVKC